MTTMHKRGKDNYWSGKATKRQWQQRKEGGRVSVEKTNTEKDKDITNDKKMENWLAMANTTRTMTTIEEGRAYMENRSSNSKT